MSLFGLSGGILSASFSGKAWAASAFLAFLAYRRKRRRLLSVNDYVESQMKTASALEASVDRSRF
jgi:uncharacterized membrane protein required for colicin V production